MVDQYGDTTIEPTDVGFTFAGGETKAGAILPTGRFASEMMPSKSEQEQRPTSSHALSAFRWGQQPRAQETGTLSLESSKKRSQNTSTNTHPRVKTTC